MDLQQLLLINSIINWQKLTCDSFYTSQLYSITCNYLIYLLHMCEVKGTRGGGGEGGAKGGG